MGSTRVPRVVFGVPPKTTSAARTRGAGRIAGESTMDLAAARSCCARSLGVLSARGEAERILAALGIFGGTPKTTRGTRVLPPVEGRGTAYRKPFAVSARFANDSWLRIIEALHIPTIRRHIANTLTTVFKQLPERLRVVDATREATADADDRDALLRVGLRCEWRRGWF